MDAAQATKVYGRAGVAGAIGGGLLAFPLLPVVLSVGTDIPLRVVSDYVGLLFWAPYAVVVGVVAGGLVGGVNGLVLSHREQQRPRSHNDQRLTAFVTSVAVVIACTWFIALMSEGAAIAVAVVALTGGMAGALLAPTVVRGS